MLRPTSASDKRRHVDCGAAATSFYEFRTKYEQVARDARKRSQSSWRSAVSRPSIAPSPSFEGVLSMLRPMLLAATLLTPALLLAAEPSQRPRYGGWGVDTADMNQHARPGDGFYDYGEGSWLCDHPIPADK